MKPPKTQQEQDAMFNAWCDKQSVCYVARTCSISVTTARKYRAKNKWDERYTNIRKKAEAKIDNAKTKRQERWAKQGQALQKVGTSKFFDDTGQLKKGVVDGMPAKTGVQAIVEGIKIEKEAVGEPSEQTQQTITIEYVGGTNGEGSRKGI